MAIGLIVKTHFDAAHHLPGYDGPCRNLHGHRWHVEVSVSGDINPQTDMLCDFKILKAHIDSMLPDHQCINDTVRSILVPTAENLVVHLGELLMYSLPQKCGVSLVSLTIYESPECAAWWTPNLQEKL